MAAVDADAAAAAAAAAAATPAAMEGGGSREESAAKPEAECPHAPAMARRTRNRIRGKILTPLNWACGWLLGGD